MSFKYLDERHYGPRTHKPHVVLLCPHDADASAFLHFNKEIVDACEVDRQTLLHFCAVERDAGSSQLAEMVGEMLAEHGFHTKVIKVTTPRGIVDANRIPEKAIRHIFDHEKHAELKEKLLKLHSHIIHDIQEALAKVRKGGVYIDIHTMSPFDPSTNEGPAEAVIESPDTVVGYIQKYTHPTGDKRPLDIITSSVVGDEEIDYITSPTLSELLFEHFNKRNIEAAYNKPYFVVPFVQTHRHVVRLQSQDVHSAIVDIPKDILVRNEFYSLEPQYDIEGMTVIASAMTDSIVETLQSKKSPQDPRS